MLPPASKVDDRLVEHTPDIEAAVTANFQNFPAFKILYLFFQYYDTRAFRHTVAFRDMLKIPFQKTGIQSVRTINLFVF